MKKKSERNTAIILTLVGAVALGIGIYLFIGKQKFLARSIVADGVVRELESGSSSKSGRTYYPVVEYRDDAGKQQTFTSQIGSSPASYEVGEPVQVRYEPGKPWTAVIVGFWEMWGVIAVFGGLGAMFLFIGAGTVYAAMHRAKMRRELPQTGRMIELPGRVEMHTTKSKTEFFVRTEWHNPTDGKMYLFDSEKVSYNPASFLTNRLIPVWIDPLNPKSRYYVDVSFLPEEA
ncbi:DUF3592 domain-containing protein [Salmonirosea aquatica]|uniref:DUF3592 domain-containing protein n=1 Tax=Salmonirosea aquatica TaxID=2654236 RepID=A0A7C9BK73_9BACT|nr:DUF3592 domain-containing protein [Cytophagaceae bacterium SJW1-29]